MDEADEGKKTNMETSAEGSADGMAAHDEEDLKDAETGDELKNDGSSSETAADVVLETPADSETLDQDRETLDEGSGERTMETDANVDLDSPENDSGSVDDETREIHEHRTGDTESSEAAASGDTDSEARGEALDTSEQFSSSSINLALLN
jgi:hypothetical protein